MAVKLTKKDTLKYHQFPIPGKIATELTKECKNAQDLSMAYTPGVAEPVLEIAKDPKTVSSYTNRANLVGVITNGTAILGLGNRGALASKPVMEGKAVLFKRFADIDSFDLELDCNDPEKIIDTVKILEPTFGGINLEDIKAPECFEIENRLKEIMDIPVFHDDQHGTAVISGAGLINALELTNRKFEDTKVCVCGAGAAGISCAKFYISLGIKPENLTMVDIEGVVYEGRTVLMDKYKQPLARKTNRRTLADAVKGCDVFLGVSAKGVMTPSILLSMNDNPIVFAMANPDPEITYDLAKSTRADVIMATGRSDYPNQINNVLGFPFIFRGALDVEAKQITENMKMAAAQALAKLAKEAVPDSVKKAYNGDSFSYSRDYIVPKPFDPRVCEWVATSVAKAAIKDGVARKIITDWDSYKNNLKQRISKFWE